MFFFILCITVCTIKEVDLWDPIDSQEHERAAETAKLIDLVQKSDQFEVKYPVKADEETDENKDAYGLDLMNILRPHQRKYDVGRKFNSRALRISNPEVLNAYKEESATESRTDLYDDLSDRSYNLKTYQKDLVRADKRTMHQLPSSRRKFIRKRSELNLEMDYSDSSDDTDSLYDTDYFYDSYTSEEDDASADEAEDRKEDRQMQLGSVEDVQGEDKTVKENVNKYVSKKHPLLKSEVTSQKPQINQIDVKASEVSSNFETLKNQLSKLVVSSNEKDTLYFDEHYKSLKKNKLYNTNENANKTKMNKKKVFRIKKDDYENNKNSNSSKIHYQSNENKDSKKKVTRKIELSKVKKKKDKVIRKDKSELIEEDELSNKNEWTEKYTSLHSRADEDDNDDIDKRENLTDRKPKMKDKHSNSNKNSEHDKTIFDWYDKQETRNKHNSPKKSDEGWKKTDSSNKNDQVLKKTITSNKRVSHMNKKTNTWNNLNERLNKENDNWSNKTNSWKNTDHSWDKKGSREINNGSIPRQDVGSYNKYDSENKQKDAWNEINKKWNEKNDKDKKNDRHDYTWSKKDYGDSLNEKHVSRNKDRDSWKKGTNSSQKEANSFDNSEKKTVNWKKEDDKDFNLNKNEDNWRKEDDNDDGWITKTNNWNLKTNSWVKEDIEDGWNKRTSSWNKNDDEDERWNKKTDNWKKEGDDGWNKNTNSWNKNRDSDDSWKKDDSNMEEDKWSKHDKHTHNKNEDEDRNVKEDYVDEKRHKKKTDWNQNDSKENLKIDSFQNIKSSLDNNEGNVKSEWGNYAMFKHFKDKKNSNENDSNVQTKRQHPEVGIKPLKYMSEEDFAPRENQNNDRSPQKAEFLYARTSIPYVGRKPIFD